MTRARRITLFVLSLSVAVASVGLGLWQRRRLAARRAVNGVALERRTLPVLTLNDPTRGGEPIGRRVVASGSYDHERTVIIRGRLEREVPGVFLVTPLRLDGRPEAVLVLRGFAPAADALRPDTALIARPERASVEGIAFAIPESADSGAPLRTGGLTSWRRLDLPALRRRLPYAILDAYVHATAGESSGGPTGTGVRAGGERPYPRPALLPPLDDGPHLGYMIQWFGIAAVALGFGVAVVRERRSGERSAGTE